MGHCIQILVASGHCQRSIVTYWTLPQLWLYTDLAVRAYYQQLARQALLHRDATASLFDKKAAGDFGRQIEEMIDGQATGSQHHPDGP